MKKRIVAYLSLLFAVFTAGAVISMLYIAFTTAELRKIITLHSVEILRQDLIIKIQNVEQDLLTVHTELGSQLDKIVSNVSDLDAAINRCSGCHHSPLVTKKLQEIKEAVGKFESTLSYYITASADESRIRALKMDSYAVGKELLAITSDMAMIANQKLQERTQGAIDDVQQAQKILIGTLILSFAFAFWIAATLTRSIIRPVRELIAVSRKITSGELGATTRYRDGTEFGELASSFNEMSVSLDASTKKVIAQVTQLQDTQEQLIQAAKLAAIGELASNVAHEINNPLTSIMGYAELIREEKDLDTILGDVEIIASESLRAREIVQQLLEFARRRPLDIRRTDINHIVREAISLVKIQIKDSRVSLRERHDELPLIDADPNQLKQVVLNLLNNAIDAVVDKAGDIEVSTASRDGQVVIAISDNGNGIPPEALPHIFEPFFTTKKEKGTGLGLSVSYKIIESHNGRIEVESRVGEGTVFTVVLPMSLHVAS